MEKPYQPIAALAKLLNLTDPEPEPYILTPEEEDAAIDHEITRLQKHKAWSMADKGAREDEINQVMAGIDWESRIDRKAILDRCNTAKQQGIWHKNQREKEKISLEKRAKDLKERCDAKYFFQLMKFTSLNMLGKPLIVNEFTTPLITALCFFLSQDQRFESQLGYDPKKGLLIRGISGLGKTHAVRCVAENELNPILILSMLEVADEIRNNGEYLIKLGEKKVIYLDDVGTEEPVIKHYGTSINFFKEFIEGVYLRNEGKTFNKLVISTNNSFAEIEAKYGFRVRSRMKDMFNVIDVKGQDMRG